MNIVVGSFVVVEFRNKKIIGLVHDLKQTSKIQKLKPISKVLDLPVPISNNQIKTLEQIADILHLSWPQTSDVFIPEFTLKKHQVSFKLPPKKEFQYRNFKLPVLTKSNFIEYQACNDKINLYIKLLKSLKREQQIFILCADKQSIQMISAYLLNYIDKKEIANIDSSLNKNQLTTYWQKIATGEIKLIIGTRRALFFPWHNLAYLIIDQASSEHHFQWDQKPRYHANEIAILIAHNHKANLIQVDCLPSPSVFLAIKEKNIKYLKLNADQARPLIDFIKMDTNGWLGYQIDQTIESALKSSQSVLILANRLHHSRLLYCLDCSHTLQCKDCQTQLNYDQTANKLVCANCLNTFTNPLMCPKCHSTKLQTKGLGIQKIQDQLIEKYPDKKVIIFDKENISNADIVIASQAILPHLDSFQFQSAIIPVIEQFLTPVDLNTNWEVNYLLHELATHQMKIIIQSFTENSAERNYYNSLVFLQNELHNRKLLNLPPVKSILKAIIKTKSKDSSVPKIATFTASIKKINDNIQISNAVPAKPFYKYGKYHHIVILKNISQSDIEKIMKMSYADIVFDTNPFKILN